MSKKSYKKYGKIRKIQVNNSLKKDEFKEKYKTFIDILVYNFLEKSRKGCK